MQLKKDEMIRDGENIFSVFCVLGGVIYAKPTFDVNVTPDYELGEVLKYYRKVEVMKK